MFADRVENDGQSVQLLLNWNLEVKLGLPHSNWNTFCRLHHFSFRPFASMQEQARAHHNTNPEESCQSSTPALH